MSRHVAVLDLEKFSLVNLLVVEAEPKFVFSHPKLECTYLTTRRTHHRVKLIMGYTAGWKWMFVTRALFSAFASSSRGNTE